MSPRRGGPIASGDALRGRVVVITRPAEDASSLAAMLVERGATALLAPAITRTKAPQGAIDGAIERLAGGGFDWVVFTSAAGVRSVLDRFPALGREVRHVRANVAAVGEGTAAALRAGGVEPTLVPRTYTTEALGRAMPDGPGSVLLARADIASDELQEELRARGWTTDTIDAYTISLSRTMPSEVAAAMRQGRVDAVTFTSASTVQGFVAMSAPLVKQGVAWPTAVCIGPVTAARARASGLRVGAVASPHTIGGLVAAVERTLGGDRKERLA